jgi:galactonate dehydratase
MKASIVQEARWHQLRVSPKTVWSFVELIDADGRTGVGEATLGQREAEMRDALGRFQAAVIGRAPLEAGLDPARAVARSLPEFSVVSALDQAVWDLAAQQRGVSLSVSLGGLRREKIRVYANINRGIASRTEEGFAAHARRAVADGFSAIKIAPFDGVDLYGDSLRVADSRLFDAALARIAAVREAIGPSVDLMVDCHWRLNRASAETVLRAAAPFALYWLECPVPETPEMLETLRHLRKLANAQGVRLAGCEEMNLCSGFAPFLEAQAYDVMMPDAKYVGGLREMLRVADALERNGVQFSPHNPSGPVCHAASLHICAVAAALDRLEIQYAETPLFEELVGGTLPRPVNGEIEAPREPGLGVRLDRALIRELEDTDGLTRPARSPAGR